MAAPSGSASVTDGRQAADVVSSRASSSKYTQEVGIDHSNQLKKCHKKEGERMRPF